METVHKTLVYLYLLVMSAFVMLLILSAIVLDDAVVSQCTVFFTPCVISHQESMPECNVYSLKPHFYMVKLGYAWVDLFFLVLLQNIDCENSLEPPRRGGSNVFPQSMF